jgi:hypothetical protein
LETEQETKQQLQKQLDAQLSSLSQGESASAAQLATRKYPPLYGSCAARQQHSCAFTSTVQQQLDEMKQSKSQVEDQLEQLQEEIQTLQQSLQSEQESARELKKQVCSNE